ncbi:MAG: Co2+/Mg2+ efflux protein ApaG [Rhodospirillales bacterium 20-64-7]|jgi:ApaG protein|nr:MAG: Co2+/Mg2+ efflux protein ApaG [Rhodospirillales bacterium 20-64-7]
MQPAFEATTNGISVSVRVFFLTDQSRPESSHFVWAYRINIVNRSAITVQLLRRTWHITDSHFRTQIVQGDGVIGEQPVLEPGESFEYTSGTPLGTPSGFMTGKYHMLAVVEGEAFDVAIPAFSLDSPHENTQRH